LPVPFCSLNLFLSKHLFPTSEPRNAEIWFGSRWSGGERDEVCQSCTPDCRAHVLDQHSSPTNGVCRPRWQHWGRRKNRNERPNSSGATAYDVKRSITTGGPYAQISTPAVPNFTDTGLTNGTKYFYVVSASNSVGQSANSAEVNATPVLPTPATPTGLAAAAGNAEVSLNWNASTGATSYHVKRSTASGSETQISAPASNSFTDTGLTNGTSIFT
jgi:hypothetical protein